MRYLILSDIHANLEALTAVLAAAEPSDHVLALGDLIGYGAGDRVDRVNLDAHESGLGGGTAAGADAGGCLSEICHGASFDEDFYIFNDLDARRAFRAIERPLCLFGHTHVPAVFGFDGELQLVGPPRGPSTVLTLKPELKYLVNVGAVGQPRDGDPRAACDAPAAQRKILAAGLPEVLAHRLAIGR